ncbi:RNA polymerase sigma factor [Gemmatimonadota bacterium]
MAGEVFGIGDASLVARARRGNSAAFEALVRRHYRVSYAVARAILDNGMDAEDVCQDAFVKALERLDDCRQPEKFLAWLLQIVRNHARNYLDYRRVRLAQPLETTNVASALSPERDAERSELRGMLEAALGKLSDVQREVVLLHDLEGWKHREIGESLGLSEGAARQHLFAARRKLRELLGAEALKEHSNG